MKPLVEPGPQLTQEQLTRYARHLPLPGVGVTGQRRLAAARVLVIGAGGLGSPVLSYLAAAGVGSLSVIDDDVVEDSNLQRQVIHSTAEIGSAKVDSAARRLAEVSPGVTVTTFDERLTAANASRLVASHDLVVDGADNFATRYLVADAAELTRTPVVWGTLFQFSGQVSTFVPGAGPLLRDLFPEVPEADSVPSCAAGGVFGALAGWVGSVLATEALKLICGVGDPLIGRLLRLDALTGSSSELRFTADPARNPVTALTEVQEVCAAPVAEVDSVPDTALLVDVREDWEREILAHPHAVAVPLGRIQQEGWAALGAPPHQDVVLMCKTGIRSATALRVLESTRPADRDTSLASYAGGVLAWARTHGADVVDY